MSLTSITEDDINEIESFVNTNRESLRTTLDVLSEYKLNSDEKFKFKPGHRSLILNLPKRMDTFLSQSTEKKGTKKLVKRTDIDLKTELINKTILYLKNAGFTVKLDANADVSDFKRVENSFSCRLKCPYCNKKILCTYMSYWRISNLETHFRVHTKALTELQANRT